MVKPIPIVTPLARKVNPQQNRPHGWCQVDNSAKEAARRPRPGAGLRLLQCLSPRERRAYLQVRRSEQGNLVPVKGQCNSPGIAPPTDEHTDPCLASEGTHVGSTTFSRTEGLRLWG
jgi:hypothetical protein